MRLLKDLLTLFGAACIGLALGGYVAAGLPLYRVNNIITIARCNLVLTIGITLLVMGYGFHRRAVFAWWVGSLAYIVLVGYFSLRTLSSLDMSSFFILLVLIAEFPFAALWWRYTKLYFVNEKDG
jgi:hypothetical protein